MKTTHIYTCNRLVAYFYLLFHLNFFNDCKNLTLYLFHRNFPTFRMSIMFLLHSYQLFLTRLSIPRAIGEPNSRQTQLSEIAQGGEEAGMLKVFLCITDGYKLRGYTLGQPHAIFGAEKFKPLGAHLQSVNFQYDNIFSPPTLGVSRS